MSSSADLARPRRKFTANNQTNSSTSSEEEKTTTTISNPFSFSSIQTLTQNKTIDTNHSASAVELDQFYSQINPSQDDDDDELLSAAASCATVK